MRKVAEDECQILFFHCSCAHCRCGFRGARGDKQTGGFAVQAVHKADFSVLQSRLIPEGVAVEGTGRVNTEISGFFKHEERFVLVKRAEMQIRFRFRRGFGKECHAVMFAERGFRLCGKTVDLHFSVPDLRGPAVRIEAREAAGQVRRQRHSAFAAENVAVENAASEFVFEVHRGIIRRGG